MKKSIIRMLTFSLVLGGVGFMSSCKDYDDDLRTEFNSQLANLDVSLNEKIDQQIGNLNAKLSELEAQLAAIKQCNCGIEKPWTSDLSTAIQNALNAVDDKLGVLNNRFGSLEELVAALEAKYGTLDGKVGSLEELLAALSEKVGSVEEQLKNILDEPQVRQIVSDILAKELSGYYTKAEVDEMVSKITQCGCDLEKLKTEIASTIQTAITTTVTKEYIMERLGDEYANKSELAALQSQIDALASTACACTDLSTAVQKIQSDLEAAQKVISQHGDDITKLYKLYNELSASLADVASKADNAYKAAQDAQKDATAAAAKAEEALTKANQTLEEVKKLYEHVPDLELMNRVTVLESFKSQWESTLNQWKSDLPKMQSAIDGLKTTVDQLKDQVSAAQNTATSALNKANDAYNKAVALEGRTSIIEQNYDALKDEVDNLKPQVMLNRDSIAILQKEIDELTKQVYVNRDSIAILKLECEANLEAAKAYTDEQIAVAVAALENKINEDLAALEEKVKEADDKTNARIDSLNEKLLEYFGPDAEKFKEVQTSIESLNSRLDCHKKHIKAIEDWIVGDFAEWQNDVNEEIQGLKDAIDDLTDRVDAIEDALEDIEDRLSSVEETLKQMITGIIVNQIYNPVFGTINFPVNTKSQVLVAFYGQNEGDNVVFPSQSAVNYLDEEEVLTDAEWEMISGGVSTENVRSGQKLIEDREDNAGKVYLTINPNTVDFTGVTLDMVNSQDENVGMTLSPLAKSDKVLDFGYTRAANNGFYEMSAKLEDEADVQKVSFETERFKEILSDLKNDQSSFDLTRLATTLYDQFNSMFDANALKATWTDGDGVEHAVVSDYSIAATAVKPLSYKFMYGKHYDNIAALDQIEKFIDRAANSLVTTLKKEISKALTINMPEAPRIKKFALEGPDYERELAKFQITTDATLTIDNAKFKIDGDLNIRDAQDNIVGKLPDNTTVKVKDGELTVTIEMDVKDVLGRLYTDVCSNVNDLVQALNDYCEKATKAVENLSSIGESVDKIADDLTSKLVNLLNKIEDRAVSYLNLAISRLQPVMLVTADGRMKRMSPSAYYPTAVEETSVILHPYSYNAEILNPAYLKHVAVVNVLKDGASAQDGDADCLAELEAVNGQENMNQAINGSIHEIEITGLKSGYTYQFAYTAMDYAGCIMTKRSAIKVK